MLWMVQVQYFCANTVAFSGMNGIVRYHSPSLPKVFKLNKHDGKITVNGKLNDAKVYHFEIWATDQGTYCFAKYSRLTKKVVMFQGEPALKSSVPVRVEVVEKARPIFSKKRYFASVSEASARNTVVSISDRSLN